MNVKAAPRSHRKLFLVLGVGGALLCPCVGLLAALVVPGFSQFSVRSKQGECKANLKAWYTAQRSYQAEHDAYSSALVTVGFIPESRNRYAYFGGPGPFLNRSGPQSEGARSATNIAVDTTRHPGRDVTFAQLPEDVAAGLGLSGKCPECEISFACAGQIDTDETLDVWTISTADREAADGSSVPKGVPFQHVDDALN